MMALEDDLLEIAMEGLTIELGWTEDDGWWIVARNQRSHYESGGQFVEDVAEDIVHMIKQERADAEYPL